MNNIRKNSYYAAMFLVILTAASLALHFYRIQYPGRAVFDEAHFATYARDYVTGQPFLDIHPPLGKLIYAAVLTFYPRQDLNGAVYENTLRAPDGTLTVEATNVPYGNFPYVALRVVSALFGAMLPLALYFLMRNLGTGRIAAGLAAIFAVLDNALLVNSRLILMDSMLIAFAVVGLALYFHKKRMAVAGGVVFGLALAVKLSAIVFVGPVIVAFFLARGVLKKEEAKRALRFVLVALGVLLVVAVAGTFYFSTAERLDTLSYFGFINPSAPQLTMQWQEAHPVKAYFLADLGETLFSISNYVAGNPHDGESPWYFWPAGQGAMTFYSPFPGEPGGSITLTGNPLLWLAATFAVIAGLAAFFRYLKEHRSGAKDHYPLFVLLGGYAACLLPFIVFVHRSTFIYHYFPALVFAFGLLGWSIAHWLHAEQWHGLAPHKKFLLVMVVLIAVIGFLSVAPGTYGL